MSNEIIVLAAFCKDRELHAKYAPYIRTIDNLDRELKLLFKLIEDYYETYEETAINEDELRVFFDNQYPAQRDRKLFMGVIHDISTTDVQEELLLDTLQNIMERHYASKLVSELLPVMEGHKFGVLPTLGATIEEYVSHMRNPPIDEVLFCTKSIKMLLESTSQVGGLPWPLPILNSVIGNVVQKTIGLIYAFVDSGKTSFAMRVLAEWVKHLKEEELLIFAGNEESMDRTALRLACTMAGVTRTMLEENTEQYEQTIIDSGFDRIRVYDNVTSLQALETIIKRDGPRAVIVDQATKLDAAKNLESVAELRLLFNRLREIAKSHNTAILGVAQGVGDAENKKFLKLSDIYGSRVAIQGELDYAIGIGRLVDDPTKDKIRYFNIPKNKMLDGDTARQAVVFNHYTNAWEEN